MAKSFDDFEEFAEPATVGMASGCGEFVSNPIGFGKDIQPPFRLNLHLRYTGKDNFPRYTLYTVCNGTMYELTPINKQARKHLAYNLFKALGAKHYEHD